MTYNSELQTQALESLKTKWGYAVLVTLISIAISLVVSRLLGLVGGFLISVFAVSDAVNIILAGVSHDILFKSYHDLLIHWINSTITSPIYLPIILPLRWGFTVLFLENLRGEKIEMAKLFDGFNDYGRILGTTLLVYIYTSLWTLLLIIPGIIKAYSYSMTPYILKDDLDLCFNGAIEKSIDMMAGHKLKLFLLDFSFLGWLLLSFLTCGIGLLWLIPYMQAARAAFYEDLKNPPIEQV